MIVCIFKRTTKTCGKLAQTQSIHISVLLFVLPTIMEYTSRQLLYYMTHTLHRISSEIYTHKLTLHEDERRTLRQLCKLFYRRQDGTSAQQSTAMHSLSLQGLWRRQTVAYDQRHRTQTYMNSWARWK